MCTKKYRILVDARVVKEKATGIGIFVQAIIQTLLQNDGIELVFLTESPDYLKSVLGKASVYYRAPGIESHPYSEIWLNTKVRQIVKKNEIDAYWGPAFLIPWVKIGCPIILTIHDLTVFTHAEEYPRRFVALMKFYIRMSIKSCNIITIPTNSVKKALGQLFPEVNQKCRIVACGVSECFAIDMGCQFAPKLPERYILAIGGGFPRKNVDVVKKAFEIIRNQTDLSLVTIDSNAKEPIIDDRMISLPLLKHNQLPQLYKSARMFIFPSLEEGFGIPVIEALACGCPIVLSDIDVLREVSANNAVYFNPKNEKELAEKILLLDTDETIRQDMISKGINRSKDYTWKNAARQLEKIVEELSHACQ